MLDYLLYENVGSKIKSFAKFIFVVGAICTIVIGIVLLANDSLLIGLLTLFLGPIVALISSWTSYAFGELVEDTHEIRTQGIKIVGIDGHHKALSNPNTPEEYENVAYEDKESADCEDEEYDNVECPNCKKTFSVLAGEEIAVCPWCNNKYRVEW